MNISLLKETFDDWSRILPKSCRFISHPTNLLSQVLYYFLPSPVIYIVLPPSLKLRLLDQLSGVQISFYGFLSKIGHLLWKNGTWCFIRSIVHRIVFVAFGTNLDPIMLPIPRLRTLEKKHGEINGKQSRRQFHVGVALLSRRIAGAIQRCTDGRVNVKSPKNDQLWQYSQWFFSVLLFS